MSTLDLAISGMRCEHCIARVAKVLQRTSGVTIQQVHVGSARVQYDPAISIEALLQTLADAGYPARATGTGG